MSRRKQKKQESPSPASQLMAEVLKRTLAPRDSIQRATGLQYPLQWYADLYQIPLVTIKRIHTDPELNPCALDHPSKLIPILMNRPGRKIDLRGMEKVVAARFAAGLKDHEKVTK